MTLPADPRTPRTAAGRRLFTDNEPMDMYESDGVTWDDVLAIEAEAAAAPDSLRSALERLLDLGVVPTTASGPPFTEQLLAVEQARAALAAPADKASEPPRAVELLRELVEAVRSGNADGTWTEREEEAIHAARSFLQDSKAGADPPAAGLDGSVLAAAISLAEYPWSHHLAGTPNEAEAIEKVERLRAALRARLSNSQKSEG